MTDESTAGARLSVGEKLAGQIINVLDSQHPEINWPFETIAALIDQGISDAKLQIPEAENSSDR